MEAVRQDQLEYTMAFDEIANAVSELELEDMKLVVDGMKSDPQKFIKELTRNVEETFRDKCREENRCENCLSDLEIRMEYNLSQHGLATAREEYPVAVCPNCGEV